MPVQEQSGPTLTSVTHIGRKAVKYGVAALIVLMVGRVVVNGFVAFWKATHPEPPPPPTVGFGVLPKIVFESQTEEQKPVSYKLETPTGSTPDFGDRAKVFFMPRAAASLLADESTKKIAAEYGFLFEPEVIGNETYRFTKSQPLLSTFEINTRTHHFTLTTNYLSLPEFLIDKQLPSGFDAVDAVKDFLDDASLLPGDVATASGEIVYLKSLGGELAPAVSPSDADFIQVDLNRNPVDQIRMYTPQGYTGSINAIIAGNDSGNAVVVEITDNYNLVDYDQFHTYPLRSSQSAWQLLQAGEGYIANKGTDDQAIIRSVTLGYYDSFEEQEYLQPVYVFENKDTGFIGYVSALDQKYIQQ